MRAFYAAETAAHAPEFFLLRGRPVRNEERAERAERLLAGLERVGITTEPPAQDAARAALATVHSPRYLDFLATAAGEWAELDGASGEVIANAQPRLSGASYPTGVVGRAGWHMGDLACPVGPTTYEAARRAADTAAAAARCVAEGAAHAYALARPPGHQAAREVAAGHCFLNNAAVAVETLSRAPASGRPSSTSTCTTATGRSRSSTAGATS